MYLALWVCIGGCSIGPGKGAKIVVERSILLDHDHDVLNGIGCPLLGPGCLGLRDRAEAKKYQEYGEGTEDAGCLCRPEMLPEGEASFLRLIHSFPLLRN